MFKKSNLLLSILVLSALTTASEAKNSSDPFIQEWDYFDGVKTFTLNITKSPAPGQDYHIDYTSVMGYAATDMCKSTSSTSFNCVSGETVTLDSATYSVKVATSTGSYVYYDPSHMPPVSGVLGNWVMTHQYDTNKANFTISIMKGASDSDFNITSGYTDDHSGYCYQDPAWSDEFHATPNPDGTETFTDVNVGDHQFKYDPKTNQITSANPGSDFYVGMCVAISSEIPILFTKQQVTPQKITFAKLISAK